MAIPGFENVPGALPSKEYNDIFAFLNTQKIKALDLVSEIQEKIDLLTDHDSGFHEFPRLMCPACH